LILDSAVDLDHQSLMIDGYGALVEWSLVWDNRGFGEKPTMAPLYPPQILHGLYLKTSQKETTG